MLRETFEHIKGNIHLLEIDYENGLVTNRKSCFDTKGYFQLTVKNKLIKTHQIIAFMKFGENAIDFHVDHINGVKTDNRPDNLEMVTIEENNKRAQNMGLIKKGEDIKHSKLNRKQVSEIRKLLEEGVKQRIIADRYGVAKSTISKISTGESWK